MRRITLVALCLAIICLAGAQGAQKAKRTKLRWPTYTSAFFTIEYPPGFSVRPSLHVTDPKNAAESAFFVSPDRSVEFYVFAARWDGNPTDIALDAKKERRSSTKTVRIKDGFTRWTTIRARDGSYARSIVATLNKLGRTGVAFQMKYKNVQSYTKYKSGYKRFKASVAVIGE